MRTRRSPRNQDRLWRELAGAPVQPPITGLTAPALTAEQVRAFYDIPQDPATSDKRKRTGKLRKNPPIELYAKALDRFTARLAQEAPGSAAYNRTLDELQSLVLRAETDPHVSQEHAAELRRKAGVPAGPSATRRGQQAPPRQEPPAGRPRAKDDNQADLLKAVKVLTAHYYRLLHTDPMSEWWGQLREDLQGFWAYWNAAPQFGVGLLRRTWNAPEVRQWRDDWQAKYGGTIDRYGGWKPAASRTRRPKESEEAQRDAGPGIAMGELTDLYLILFGHSPASPDFVSTAEYIRVWWRRWYAKYGAAFSNDAGVLDRTWNITEVRHKREAWLARYGGSINDHADWLPPASHNPVERLPDGYYAVLPRRFALTRGGEWWLGPFAGGERAYSVAGMVRGAPTQVLRGPNGHFVRVYGGLRVRGAPRIGPFVSPKSAGAVLGRLLPDGERPELSEGESLRRQKPPPDIGFTVRWSKLPSMGRPKAETVDLAPPEAPPRPLHVPVHVADNEAAREAISALRSLGYRATEAKESVAKAVEQLGPQAGVNDLIGAVFRGDRAARNPRSAAACLWCGRGIQVPRRAANVECPHCGAIMEVER